MGFTFTYLVMVTAVVTAALQIGEIYLSKKPTPTSTTDHTVRTARETQAGHCPAQDPNTGCKCSLTCTSPTTETPATTRPVYKTLTPISHRSRPPTTTETAATTRPVYKTLTPISHRSRPPTTAETAATTRPVYKTLTPISHRSRPPTTAETAATTRPVYKTLTPISHRSRPPTTTETTPTAPTTAETTPTPLTTTSTPRFTTTSATVTTTPPTTTSKTQTTWYTTTVTDPPTTPTASPTTTTTDVESTTTLSDPKNCQDVFNNGGTTSKVYFIFPGGRKKVKVFCEQALEDGGWTVFQRRMDGSVNFTRGWTDYKQGFGTASAEHWLGNDVLHILTSNRDTELLVELEHGYDTAYARYSYFWIENENYKYQLTVSGYSGSSTNPGNALEIHDGMSFATADRKYDHSGGHCSSAPNVYPWWACGNCNLNAPYRDGHYYWYTWSGHVHGMTASRMMLKAK